MKRKHAKRMITTAAVLMTLFWGCSSGGDTKSDTGESENVIKNYVNQPKSKAMNAREKVESGQRDVDKQAEELLND